MRNVKRRSFLTGATAVAATTAVAGSAAAEDRLAGRGLLPYRLSTDHLIDPLGIDDPEPRFGWRLAGSGTERRQTAYRIRVRTGDDHDPVWDSGRVESNDQHGIGYGGTELEPRTRYIWSVRVWDEAGVAGPWSRSAWFETGLPAGEPWPAQWIGSGIELPKPTRTLQPAQYVAEPITGHTLGQTFTTAGPIVGVAILVRAAGDEPATVTLRLLADGPDGDQLATAEVTGLAGEMAARLDLDQQRPAGTYYLEATTDSPCLSWASADGNPEAEQKSPYADGAAYTDGKEQPLRDRWLYGLPPDPPADPLLRTTFELPERPARARLHLIGLGHGRAMINGHRVDDFALSPPATDYDRRLLATTHDVTTLLRAGGNGLGVALGRGFFGSRAPDSDGSNLYPWTGEPRLLALLEAELPDGTMIKIASGPDWRLTEGPVTYDGVYTGETFDGRREAALAGWSESEFDDSDWSAAVIMESPGGRIEAYPNQPIRTDRPLRPTKVTEPEPGTLLYDFGEVTAGWVRLRGRLPRGTKIIVQYSEKLGDSGRIELGAPAGVRNPSVTGRHQRDEYVAAGGPVDWQPWFTYQGFRYVEVTGGDRSLRVEAVPVHSDLDRTMRLRVAEPVLQWIVDATLRTNLNALHGQPDVAPMYTKLAWLAQPRLASATLLNGFDSAAWLAKWLDDLRLSQAESGALGIVAPLGPFPPDFPISPSYTGSYAQLVRQHWEHYGDRSLVLHHLPAVLRYVTWLLAGVEAQGGLAMDVFADWYPPHNDHHPAPPEGGQLVGTAYVIESVRDLATLTDLAGETAEAAEWRAKAEALTDRFNEAFLDRAAGLYRTSETKKYRQASNAIPLALDLVPAEYVDRVAARLARDVEDHDRHLNTGSVGTWALPYALSDHGNADLALAVLGQHSYPGYGFWRSLGGTTLWENWETDSRGHQDPMLSGPVQWLLERVVGLELLRPGWSRFRVAPRAYGDLPSASVELDTVRGRIEVGWERRKGRLRLTVQVPVNAVAEVTLPGEPPRELGSGRHRLTTGT
ncbi:family 78 glycoside hydrolase catalytic domain [Microlunatus parietis]|uniref:alpha-L-rhamnosidase n=1 Tax=Microlunatus parietis TaxID=682979 RepID=A0A7Y9LFM1_9ACTN|nr:family 78 glycoside hydrolase catalytic domain [Microlunatus parietis]NYE74983.1 alpha-L-rhamnosidase [Microlunatus parietis]